MKTWMMGLLLLALQARAEKASTVYMDVLEEDADASLLQGEDVVVRRGLSTAKPDVDQLPSPEVRDQLFARAGLANDVEKWDDLDRDIFYRKVQAFSERDLKEAYPKLSTEKLRKARDVMGATR